MGRFIRKEVNNEELKSRIDEIYKAGVLGSYYNGNTKVNFKVNFSEILDDSSTSRYEYVISLTSEDKYQSIMRNYRKPIYDYMGNAYDRGDDSLLVGYSGKNLDVFEKLNDEELSIMVSKILEKAFKIKEEAIEYERKQEEELRKKKANFLESI